MSTEKGGAARAVTMPGEVRRGLIWAAVALAAVAAAGNFGHVYDFATDTDHGKAPAAMGVVVALLPDVTLILCLIKLRFARWYFPAWVGLALSVAFVGYGSVRMTSGVDGRIVALTPLAAACVAALLLELNEGQAVQAEPVKRKAADRVKPQVGARLTPSATPVLEPARLRSVTPSDDLAEWVREQRAAGVKRAEVIRVAVPRFKVSESTVIRRWKEAA